MIALKFSSTSLSQMHKPSPVVFRGILSTVHGLPRRCLRFPTNSNYLQCSLGYHSYCSSTALRMTEKPNMEFSYESIPEKVQPWDDLNESPSCNMDVLGDRRTGNRISTNGLESVDEKNKLKMYSKFLRNCVANMSLREGKVIHGRIIRSGVEPDLYLWVSLLNLYAKCGAMKMSRYVFEQMPTKDVVSWTALISGFVAHGNGIESARLFCHMRRDHVSPNEFTLATVVKGCSISLDLEFGKQLHGEVVKLGVLSDVYIGSSLIDLYSKCEEMGYADDIFHMMPEKNVVLWNTLLNGYARVGHGDAVWKLFCEMEEPKMKFSKYTVSIVLKGISSSGPLRAGQAIHSIVIKIGGEFDDFVSCSLVNMYSKCGRANDALKVFETLKNPDIVGWSSIISVLDQQGMKGGAAKLFCSMRHNGVRPNQFTLSSIVSVATDFGDLRYCQSIHACVHKFGFESDTLVSNALIGMYMKLQSICDAYHIFNKMANRDVVSWNSLLSGFHDETSGQGFRIFMKMLMEGLKPNVYSFISTLRSCSSFSNVELGKQMHSHIIKDSFLNHDYVGTALLDMYAKCGRMEEVEAIFSRLNERDVFTWTVVISGYSQANEGEKAARSFNLMRREGVTPNEFTLASCLSACSGIASLENGRSLHSLSIKSGHSTDFFVASSLIDMYSKCGCIGNAELLFGGLGTMDTVLWNTIICGYSHHGEGQKALQVFSEMVKTEVLPDEVTFVGILSACSHMGLVEEGRKYFYAMRDTYGITPNIEHYACFVDILGRAGKFNEVESLIEHMEITPNVLIWENVLGACRLHGNIELGEIAANKLFQIDPETDSNYILLSNLYASRGRWSDVSKVRASMSSKGIKKEPGCSWVLVDAQVHVFSSQDVSHPSLFDIHQKLEELRQRVSESGYMPNTKHALHNVTDSEKRDNLFHHSERLALGFALINKVSGGKIRIFKNLRICPDCHEFIKFVSGTVNQEIIVRDARRFHHFHGGMCSCKDYW